MRVVCQVAFVSTWAFCVVKVICWLSYAFVGIETWAVYIPGRVEFVGTMCCYTRQMIQLNHLIHRTTSELVRIKYVEYKLYCKLNKCRTVPNTNFSQGCQQEVFLCSLHCTVISICKLIQQRDLGSHYQRTAKLRNFIQRLQKRQGWK